MTTVGGIDYTLLTQAILTALAKKTVALVTNVTIPPGGYVDSDPLNIQNSSGGAINVNATFASGATAGLRVIVLQSVDGDNFDDEDEVIADGNYFDVGYDSNGNFVKAGKTTQKTSIVTTVAPYVKIRFRNLDASQSLTVNSSAITLIR